MKIKINTVSCFLWYFLVTSTLRVFFISLVISEQKCFILISLPKSNFEEFRQFFRFLIFLKLHLFSLIKFPEVFLSWNQIHPLVSLLSSCSFLLVVNSKNLFIITIHAFFKKNLHFPWKYAELRFPVVFSVFRFPSEEPEFFCLILLNIVIHTYLALNLDFLVVLRIFFLRCIIYILVSEDKKCAFLCILAALIVLFLKKFISNQNLGQNLKNFLCVR